MRDELALPIRAGDEARTRDLHLGKVALYQLSYSRIMFKNEKYSKGIFSDFLLQGGAIPVRYSRICF
jgi:hypothetical protein